MGSRLANRRGLAFPFFTLFLSTLFTCSARAANEPPPLAPLKGVVLSSLVNREGFQFSPGNNSQCTRVVLHNLIHFTCATDGAAAKVTGANGVTKEFPVGELHVLQQFDKEGDWMDYIYFGQWQEAAGEVTLKSKVTLKLRYYLAKPSAITGTLLLNDYGTSAGIEAHPETH